MGGEQAHQGAQLVSQILTNILALCQIFLRFGDDLVMPDPRGSVETEEEFLKKYDRIVQ